MNSHCHICNILYNNFYNKHVSYPRIYYWCILCNQITCWKCANITWSSHVIYLDGYSDWSTCICNSCVNKKKDKLLKSFDKIIDAKVINIILEYYGIYIMKLIM